MFKWVWRFTTQRSSLWDRVIKVIHGDDGKMGKYHKSAISSPWLDIVHELELFKQQAKFAHTSIDHSFRRCPRSAVEQTQLSDLRSKLAAVSLVDVRDKWKWSLEGSGDFSVSSIRKLIDDKRLPDVSSKTHYELAAKLQEEEREELTIEEKSKMFVELMNKRKKHFEMLRAEEKMRKPPTKAQKRKQMCTYLKNMAGFTHNQLKSKSFEEVQQAFNKTMDWINSFVAMDSRTVKDREVESSKRAGDELEYNKSKKQKLDENVEAEVDDSAELKRCLKIVQDDGDDLTIEATLLSFKSLTITDYKIYKEGKKNYFPIIRADGNSQIYLTFGQIFKNFNREDLKVL
nr:RNA-directed DNA polymerase, eukaryota [Tanacetum cinerariifolium]